MKNCGDFMITDYCTYRTFILHTLWDTLYVNMQTWRTTECLVVWESLNDIPIANTKRFKWGAQTINTGAILYTFTATLYNIYFTLHTETTKEVVIVSTSYTNYYMSRLDSVLDVCNSLAVLVRWDICIYRKYKFSSSLSTQIPQLYTT